MEHNEEDFQKVREQFERLTRDEYTRVIDAIYQSGDRCNFPNIEQLLEFVNKSKGEPKT